MLEKLQELLPQVYKDVVSEAGWDSLIINRRKPHTYRIFKQYDNLRVCLHKFEPCDSDEAFSHPHPWPGAFLVLYGGYEQTLGYSNDLTSKPEIVSREILKPGSMYEITNPKTWHSVRPLRTTYTIMVNGPPFESPHKEVRTTKGKDLEKMSEQELIEQLGVFNTLLYLYQGK